MVVDNEAYGVDKEGNVVIDDLKSAIKDYEEKEKPEVTPPEANKKFRKASYDVVNKYRNNNKQNNNFANCNKVGKTKKDFRKRGM